MPIDFLRRPVVFTAAVTVLSVAGSVAVATVAMLIAGYDDFLFAYGLAGGMPALAAPVTVYPLVKANRKLRAAQAELERMALTDVLTGLPNRRAFFDEADRLFPDADAKAKSVVVMMIDLDHFKATNDAHGHIAGDAVLAAVGQAIRGTVAGFGALDWTVARMGGEEFAVVATGLTPSAVAHLADRIGRDVRALDCRHGGEPVPASVSIGVAIRQREDGIDTVLKAADDACFVAKRAGRDRWSLARGKSARSEPALPLAV